MQRIAGNLKRCSKMLMDKQQRGQEGATKLVAPSISGRLICTIDGLLERPDTNAGHGSGHITHRVLRQTKFLRIDFLSVENDLGIAF